METRLLPGHGVTQLASDAARAAFESGGSPRAQIDAARAATGKKLNYAPHQGKAERERRMKRLEKANSGG